MSSVVVGKRGTLAISLCGVSALYTSLLYRFFSGISKLLYTCRKDTSGRGVAVLHRQYSYSS